MPRGAANNVDMSGDEEAKRGAHDATRGIGGSVQPSEEAVAVSATPHGSRRSSSLARRRMFATSSTHASNQVRMCLRVGSWLCPHVGNVHCCGQ